MSAALNPSARTRGIIRNQRPQVYRKKGIYTRKRLPNVLCGKTSNWLERIRMRIKSAALIGLGIVGLLITSSLALYYEQQAARYRKEWSAAVEQFDRIAKSATPMPVPAVLKAQSRARPAAVKRDAAANPDAPPRREPDPPAVENSKPAPAPAAALPPRDRSRRSPDWMENLRSADPDRYEQMQQRRREMQQYAQNSWTQTTNYFMSRDTSNMTEPELADYNRMLTLIGQTWELNQQLQSSLPTDARQEVMATVRSNVTALVPLLNNERNSEYYDMALAMGQSKEDAAAFVNYVNQITSNTSLRAVLPGIRFGGMQGGRPAGANPPAPPTTPAR